MKIRLLNEHYFIAFPANNSTPLFLLTKIVSYAMIYLSDQIRVPPRCEEIFERANL